MKIWTSEENIRMALNAVNIAYGGNVEFNREPEKDGRAFACTLRVKSSKGPGARRSHTGRRLVAACWHVHRDFMQAVYTLDSGARIQTAMADYKNADEFAEKFAATGTVNIGSPAEYCAMQSACDC